jgi:CubicO group peptidase (beta-lactamase class C family)
MRNRLMGMGAACGVLIALIVPCAIGHAATPAAKAQPESADSVGQLVRGYAEQRGFSGVVLVARDGKPLYQAAFGVAQPGWSTPLDTDAVFRIGSLSKPMTATLVMRLAELGRIDLDQTVGFYLPKLYAQTDAGRITLRQLLSHTSGLADVAPRYTDPFWSSAARRAYTPTEFAREWIPGALASKPGVWRYNNNGYFLLGLIIEAATGKSYAENLRQHILQPADMRDSGVFDGRTILPKLALATVQADDGSRELPQYIDPSVSYAAAGVYASAQDLLRFDAALADGRLLGQAAQREMFTDRGNQYGYGWGVEDWSVQDGPARPVVVHTGSIPGYQSMLVRSLSDRVTIIILNNAWQGAVVVGMARDIADQLHGKPVSLPKRSLADVLTPVLYQQGLDAMRAAYARLSASEPENYDVSEKAVNAFGYSLLRKQKVEAAVQVMRWNAEAYPASPNVHDSLAETLLAAGDIEGARIGYARVLALDPGNRHAAAELEKLRSAHP